MPGAQSRSSNAIPVWFADDDLNAIPDIGALPRLTAGTDRSGTAATTSGPLAAANPVRKSLSIQNVGANNIGVNEFGGAASIGSAGTYTIAPGAGFKVATNRAVTVIAATAATAYTATEN